MENFGISVKFQYDIDDFLEKIDEFAENGNYGFSLEEMDGLMILNFEILPYLSLNFKIDEEIEMRTETCYYGAGYHCLVVDFLNEFFAFLGCKFEIKDDTGFYKDAKYCVVSQTTVDIDNYEKIVEKLNSILKDTVMKNTICSATKERQLSAKNLAKEVDCMIVIGGKHSSNTQKLVNICKDLTNTFAIETKDELNKEELKNYKSIGITAGASTPDWIIKEVINIMEGF